MEFIEQKHRQMLLKYNRTMEERREFLKELKEIRGDRVQLSQQEIKYNIGPTWYQVLSVRQRMSLDTLSRAIYQDILEGRPIRTMEIIRVLGILPRPNKMAVQHCMYLGRNDPKVFLAELFSDLYQHPISGKRYLYDLNMRMILSSIFYLGLDDMTTSLREQFKPDKPEPSRPLIAKKRRTVCASPYLQKMEAPLYKPEIPKLKPPPPLPDLSFLNKRLEEEEPPPPRILKPVPAQPLPPPQKKRIYRAQCDKFAEILLLQQDVPKNVVIPKPVVKNLPRYRKKSSKTNLQEGKKKEYGLNLRRKRKKKTKKPQPPSTGLENVQFVITGVYTYKDSYYYIISTVYTLPPQGIILNGGHTRLPNGEYGLIHLGWSYRPSPDQSDQCECLEMWDNAVFRHIQNTKCYCGHRYDFGNEGTYPEEELPLFIPPTRRVPMQFNYDAIYQMDPKILQIQKEFKKVWDSESILQEDVDSEMAVRRKKKKKKKEAPKPDKTKPCLGEKPDLQDYLRCALRFQARTNIAARLPDVHRAPELRAWMRRRVHGPYTTEQKEALMIRSLKMWSCFKTFQNIGQCKADLPSDPSFSVNTSWKHKFKINKQFRKVIKAYKIELYTAQAYANNLLWATTYDAEYPDEKFREIFFTYLAGHITDVDIIHPYCRYENAERIAKRARNHYKCSAKGAGDVERY